DDALAGEGRLGVDYLDARVGQPFRGTVAKRADDVAHAVHHEREIDVDARVHAEVLGPARAAGVMCRAQERLRGRTPVVDAAAADVVALDKHHATALCQVACEGISALTAADNDSVRLFHTRLLPNRRLLGLPAGGAA